jgi:hypothetical protein
MNQPDGNTPYAGPEFGDEETEAVVNGASVAELFRRPGLWEMYNATGAESAVLMQHLEDIQACREIIIAEQTNRAIQNGKKPPHTQYGVGGEILSMWNTRSWSFAGAVSLYRRWHGKPDIFFVRHTSARGGILGQGVASRSWKEFPEPFVFNLKPPSSLRDLSAMQRMFTPKKRTPILPVPESVFGTWVANTYKIVTDNVRKAHVEQPAGILTKFLGSLNGALPKAPEIDESVYGKVKKWTRDIDYVACHMERLRKAYAALRQASCSLDSSQRGWIAVEQKRVIRKKVLDSRIEGLVQTHPDSRDFIKNLRNQQMLVIRTASEIIDRTAASLPLDLRYVKP